jgi:transcriptional regulator with XRE-family HTH domain
VNIQEVNTWIGENVAYERHRLGISQVELANRLGALLGKKTDQATVARLEKGARPVPVHEVFALCQLFGLADRPWLLTEPPQRLRWRRTLDAHRDRAARALILLAAQTAEFLEAAEAEQSIVEQLARELDEPMLPMEAGRPQDLDAIRVVVEAFLAHRDRADAAPEVDRAAGRREEADRIMARLSV